TEISATTRFVAGSKRASVPLVSVINQTLPAPAAIPPSLSPIVVGSVAVTVPVFRSTRDIVDSPQLGTHRVPKPAASPEHGALPTLIRPTTALARGSMRVTEFAGSFETHTSSSMASQSGAPGTAKT